MGVVMGKLGGGRRPTDRRERGEEWKRTKEKDTEGIKPKDVSCYDPDNTRFNRSTRQCHVNMNHRALYSPQHPQHSDMMIYNMI
jgi:hypothetical protein